MKILIITVYNSYNFGSLLQAKKLFKLVSQYGDVSFYDSRTRSLFKLFVHKARRTIVKKERLSDIIKGPCFEYGEMRRLKKCWTSLRHTKSCTNSDVVILGSDEIWNLTRDVCRHPEYWGGGLYVPKIAYAPSINNTQIENLNNYPEYIEYLNKIDFISVRDNHSRDVVGAFCDKPVEVVLDPTLLYKPEAVEFRYPKPYIAVYLFEGSLDEEDKRTIIQFARSRNLDLVSAGQYINWCDYRVHSVHGNPFFIYENAQYVITNTFHGTAYAINYNVTFAAFVKKKTKVVDMLNQLRLEDRIVHKPADLETILSNPIDYCGINLLLEIKREESLNFIKSAFGEMK
jgi:hypothetical protein